MSGRMMAKTGLSSWSGVSTQQLGADGNALLVVSNGVVALQPDLAVSFAAAGFMSLSKWNWYDSTVVQDNGSAQVTKPNGGNARVVRTLTVKPFRQCHMPQTCV